MQQFVRFACGSPQSNGNTEHCECYAVPFALDDLSPHKHGPSHYAHGRLVSFLLHVATECGGASVDHPLLW